MKAIDNAVDDLWETEPEPGGGRHSSWNAECKIPADADPSPRDAKVTLEESFTAERQARRSR